MTDLERVENIFNLLLSLVCTKKIVTVRTRDFSVDFSSNKVYHLHTDKVSAESEYLYDLFDLVKHTVARASLCSDIEILLDGKVFAVIKE